MPDASDNAARGLAGTWQKHLEAKAEYLDPERIGKHIYMVAIMTGGNYGTEAPIGKGITHGH